MNFVENQYYHLYNRTNNEEVLFRSRENYIYFLKKYRYYLDDYFNTIAYCLMPTHFHFLVKVKELEKNIQHIQGVGHLKNLKDVGYMISRAMQTFQSSYTKAINKKYDRHGSLFQAHYKAKHIEDEKHFISLIFYIHQNPMRSELTVKPEEWEFTSYKDYIDLRKGTLPDKKLLMDTCTIEEIRDITENQKFDI